MLGVFSRERDDSVRRRARSLLLVCDNDDDKDKIDDGMHSCAWQSLTR